MKKVVGFLNKIILSLVTYKPKWEKLINPKELNEK
jgi:hypothetical protein